MGSTLLEIHHTMTPTLSVKQTAKTCSNLHVIRVQYHGATNHRGSRFTLRSDRFKCRRTFDYDDNMGHTLEQAHVQLARLGFVIVAHAEGPQWDYIITSTFQPF